MVIRTEKELKREYEKLYSREIIKDEDRAYAWMAERFAKGKGVRRVLDIACGGGFMLRDLSNYAEELYGLDISDNALRIARQKLPDAKLFSGSAEELPFEDSFFDLVTCLGSLEHFLHPEKALEEAKRVLKSRGTFLVMVPNIVWWKDILAVLKTGTRVQRNQANEIFCSLGEWQEMIETAGFKVEETVKYNGIARGGFKQFVKDLVIPLRFSYHFIFVARKI